MYKVIGSDRQVYGPVTLEQLRQWLGEGRINSATLVQLEGGMEWKPLSAFPEFGVPPAVGTPPPVSMPPAQAREAGDNFAIAGLVLGVLSIVGCCIPFVFGVLGVIFSSLALGRERHPGHPDTSHKSMALSGLILSIIGLIWHCLLFAGLLGFHRHWRNW